MIWHGCAIIRSATPIGTHENVFAAPTVVYNLHSMTKNIHISSPRLLLKCIIHTIPDDHANWHHHRIHHLTPAPLRSSQPSAGHRRRISLARPCCLGPTSAANSALAARVGTYVAQTLCERVVRLEVKYMSLFMYSVQRLLTKKGRDILLIASSV